jgi:hypothetical protein
MVLPESVSVLADALARCTEAGWARAWARLTQLTALECCNTAASAACAVVLGAAALTGLRRLRIDALQVPDALARGAAAAATARHWPAPTRPLTLVLAAGFRMVTLGREAAAQLSVRLAPLAAGLVPEGVV